MSLYVGNLHPACNESILFKKFSLVGKILSVKVCRDSKTSKSLGYGYVNFAKKEDAEKAIETMGYDLLFNRAIRIMWASKNPTRYPTEANLVVKNIDRCKNELDLKEMFEKFGEVVSIKVATNGRGDSKGYAFVQFAEVEAAEKAKSEMDDTEVDGKPITVTRYIPAEERRQYHESAFPNNICITKLSAITKEELVRMCEAFGDVVSVKVVNNDDVNSDGFAFVSFRDRDSAKKAIVELNRLCLNGKKLNVSFVVRKQKAEKPTTTFS